MCCYSAKDMDVERAVEVSALPMLSRFPVTHSKHTALLKAELFVYAAGGCVDGFNEERKSVRFYAMGIDNMRNSGSC